MRLILDIALAHLAGRGRQSVVAVLGVAVGVGFSIAMAALMQGTQEDFIAQLVDTMPHVEITDETRTARRQPAEEVFAAVSIAGLRPKEDRRGILNPTAALAALRPWVPGTIAPALTTQGVIRYTGRDIGATIIGIDPQAEAQVSSIAGDFQAGSFASLEVSGNNVVVGDGMAERLGATLGSRVNVVSATGLTRAFKIVGLFHSGATARDEGEAYVLLKNAQVLSERANAINRIRLRLDDTTTAPPVAARAEAQLGYKAVSWQEANESVLEALVVRNVVMYTVVAAIMLVAGFGILNIVSTITHQKARDIAILKSLGFPQADMQRLFVLEALAVGLAGSLLGWALGFGLALALSKVSFEMRGVGRELTHLPLAWSLWHYAIAAGFALLSAVVAGWLPSRRAARLNPVDIIRGAT
jgi:lipoprotein-releasing system permease protein